MKPMHRYTVTAVDDGESHFVDAHCAIGAATRWAQVCKRDLFSGQVRVRAVRFDGLRRIESEEMAVSVDDETGLISVDEEV